MAVTVKAERGCGFRTRGDLYSTVKGSPFGKPLEYFLCDPPITVDEEDLGLTDLGVSILPDAHGVHHIWDIVGRKSYPNVADFVEEMRYFLGIGREAMSRKIPKNLDFSKLELGSRHILLHRNAFIENFREFYVALYELDVPLWSCPKHLPGHALKHDEAGEAVYPQEMCAGLWWKDVVGNNTEVGIRFMPSFNYPASPPIVSPEHRLAIFASLPITSLTVIKDDRRHGTVQQLVDRIAATTELPVDLEDV